MSSYIISRNIALFLFLNKIHRHKILHETQDHYVAYKYHLSSTYYNKLTQKKHNVHKKNLGIKNLIIEVDKSYLFVKAFCINLDKQIYLI